MPECFFGESMKRYLTGLSALFIYLLMYLTSAPGQTFQDFLNRVHAAPDSLKPAIVDSFMNAVPSFPYIEQDTLVHFIFRGNVSSVTVPGDANGWDMNAFSMTHLSGTDMWYVTATFESDARLDYKFVLNGTYWILDPLNPFQMSGGFGPNSELRMPLYVPPPEIQYYPGIPHGSLFDTLFYSAELGNSRHVKVYTPPRYTTTSDSFGVIVFHDGLEYLSLANARNILDDLIWKKRIQPIIAVFVPPVNREAEYAGSQKAAFASFLVHHIMAWVDATYRTRHHPEYRATLGASNGGNIALYLGLYYSTTFGNIAAQSSNVQATIADGYHYGPQLNLRFYLDLGSYDIPVLIPLVNHFVQILQQRGYPYRFHLYHEGHSWGNWRAHVDNALEMFFPGPAQTLINHRLTHREFKLYANYPNPFNATTRISFYLNKPGEEVSLRVFNIRGQTVRIYRLHPSVSGDYSVFWDGRDESGNVLPSGVYFYRLTVDSHSTTRKMVLIR